MAIYKRVQIEPSDRREWKASYSILSWTSKSFWVYFGMGMVFTGVFSLIVPLSWPRSNNLDEFVGKAVTFFGVTLLGSLLVTSIVTLRQAIDLRFGFKRTGSLQIKRVIDLNEYKLLVLSDYELFLIKKMDKRLGAADVGSILHIERTATYKLIRSRLRLKKPAHNTMYK
jgi:hypothetical protein